MLNVRPNLDPNYLCQDNQVSDPGHTGRAHLFKFKKGFKAGVDKLKGNISDLLSFFQYPPNSDHIQQFL